MKSVLCRGSAEVLSTPGVLAEFQSIGESKAALALRNQSLIEALGEIVYDHDLVNDSIEWGGDPQRCTGWTIPELGRTIADWRDRIHPEDVDSVFEQFWQGSQQPFFTAEYRFRCKNGHYIWVFDRGRLLRDERSRIVRVIGLMLDISERRAAEQHLRARTSLTEALLQSSPNGIIVVDSEGRTILQNQRVVDLWKMPPELASEVDDQKRVTFVMNRTKDPDRFIEKVQHLYRNPLESSHDEIELVDGTILDRTSAPVIDKHGNYHGRVWNFHDITAERLADKRVADELNFNRTILDASPCGIITYRASGEMTSANEAAARLIGARLDQLAGSNFRELESWKKHGLFAAAEEVLKTGRGQWLEAQILTSFGKSAWLAFRLVPFTYGSEPGLLVMLTDIEEQKRSQAALQESERRFRQLAEHIEEVFYISDPATHRMIYISPGYEKLWGESPAALMEDPDRWLEAIHPDDRGRVRLAAQAETRGSYDETYRIVRADGSQRWIRDRAFPVRSEAGEVHRIVGTAIDITERALAEQRISRQAALLDHASDAILVKDFDGRILFWNKGAECIYGWSASEALGQLAPEFFYLDPRKFAEGRKELEARGEWQCEMPVKTKDGKGRTVYVRWTLVPEHVDGKAIMSIHTDVTEKKKLEARFLRAQRLESIGTLAGGIAHDLNNILAPIMMSVQLLDDVVQDREAKSLLSTIEATTRRGADLVQQVLSFARGVEGERATINVGHILREIQRIVRETFPRNILFSIDRGVGVWTAHADATQIHQVLMNLCVNARDAMPNGGTLRVRLDNVVIDEMYADMHPHCIPGRFVCIDVGDTGCGIPKEIQEKIFEPFFTTKEVGKGTGLGLATTMTIVKSHGGFIDVKSKVGEGSSFKIYLPATAEGSADASRAQTKQQAPRGDGELILVVDDEENIRSITASVLERANSRVALAGNGAAAVAEYVRRNSEVAVVVTDLAMPVMDGRATIKALKSLNPDVRIIACSGHATNPEGLSEVSRDIKAFLPKPFSAEALLNAIHSALAGRKAEEASSLVATA